MEPTDRTAELIIRVGELCLKETMTNAEVDQVARDLSELNFALDSVIVKEHPYYGAIAAKISSIQRVH